MAYQIIIGCSHATGAAAIGADEVARGCWFRS